ncbi:hypothetical protein LSUE1_G003435 [Lachnellula suecica]|uniref:Apple domain-containing protein n=1 Tax=Lachnellula suecica TaxID=602035 RepID=A0A8T9CHA7_9HELO|nr:hypothetical protein LSUE1_G003435 [Lachnellula suecica]
MRQAVLLAGIAAIAAASPAPSPVSQGIDFAAINAAPSPSVTGPPISASTQSVVYNTASVVAEGSAAVTGVASASATASQAAHSKRTWWDFGWSWGIQPQPSPSKSTTTSQAQPAPTTSKSSSSQGSGSTTTSKSVATSTIAQSEPTDTVIPTVSEACATQPDGYGPKVQPDTVVAFEAYAPFHQAAQSAKAPAGYVSTFVDLNASVTANTYLGLQTFTSYDVTSCSEYCDNTTLCTGFNIFVERDPSVNPSDNCTNPASIINYKCTLWGSGVDAASATNVGQTRDQFQVVIAGSDGFTKVNTTTPASPPGWQAPQQCGSHGSAGHNHPSTCIGTSFFPGPYNPLLCASYAAAQNAINAKSGYSGSYNPLKCNFFNSYMLKKNGSPLGTYCGLYAQQYSGNDADYLPGWQRSDFWSIESSWGFSIL